MTTVWVGAWLALAFAAATLVPLLLRERDHRRAVEQDRAAVVSSLHDAQRQLRDAERDVRELHIVVSRAERRADEAEARAQVVALERDALRAREGEMYARLAQLLERQGALLVAPAAEVRPPAPGPEQRAVEAATATAFAQMDAVLKNGAAKIVEAYQAAGKVISESDALEQARRALNGEPFLT